MTGRELPPTSPFAGDDGSADPGVAAALAALGAGTGTLADVVAALGGTRVLVPVLAELEAAGTVEHDGHAHTVDKEASAGIVALQAPDGRTALPVFSSVAAMTAWRRDARPVPTDVVRAALSAVSEGWELLVLDAGGPVTALLPRPAVWALAQQQAWRPAVVPGADGAVVDPEVRAAVRAAVATALAGVVVPAARGGSPASATAPATPTPAPAPARSWFGRRRRSGAPGAPPADAPPATAPHADTPSGDAPRATAPGATAPRATAPGATAAGGPAAGDRTPVRDVDAVPGSRAEVAVVLTLVPGLDRPALDAVLRRVGEALAADETVTQRVDSLEVTLR